jgi:hypothetical protein
MFTDASLSGILSEPAAAGDGAAAAGEGDDPRDAGCDLVPTRRELRRVAGAFESDIVQIQKEVSLFAPGVQLPRSPMRREL